MRQPVDAPMVSVIIPAYNSLPHIFETLDSVLKQTMGDLEIIVVDDGSTDGTADTVSGYDPRIRVLRQENQGIAAARNAGLAAARGRYLAFFDHDDIWHPGKLQAQLAIFAAHPEFGVVISDFIRWPGGELPPEFDAPLHPEALNPRLTGFVYHEFVLDNQLFGTVLFRREIVEQVGAFDPTLPPSDDWDYMIRASRITQFAMMRDKTTLYRTHEGQTSKRVSPVNTRVLFRERTLSRFGMQSPDGTRVDPQRLRHYQYLAYLSFGADHFRSGDPQVALQAFLGGIRNKPWAPKAYLYAIQTLPKVLARTRA